jgi:hypothetical protein
MDAKRLEELAVWAETEANALDYEGSAKSSERLRDLARCAAAWAKVERGCCNLSLMPLERQWQHINHAGRFFRYGDTAIAAVEAAPEVTDANKG